MSKAGYGLMMGLGKGLAETGGMFAREAMAERADERAFNRQTSLEEIRQRYQEGVRDEERRYETSAYLDPESDPYKARTVKEKAELENQKALIKERGAAYGYGSKNGMFSKLNLDLYTPESAQEFAAHMQDLAATDPELANDPEALFLAARAKFGNVLVPKTTKGSTSAASNAILEEVNLFDTEYDIDTKREIVIRGGADPAAVESMSEADLVRLFQEQQTARYRNIQEVLGGGGLMNQGQDAGIEQEYEAPSQRAIEALQANPSPARIREFNDYFGPGAAERVLGQGQ